MYVFFIAVVFPWVWGYMYVFVCMYERMSVCLCIYMRIYTYVSLCKCVLRIKRPAGMKVFQAFSFCVITWFVMSGR